MDEFYTFEHYRDLIRHKIEVDPQRWGLQSRLAKAAGCQQAYLSQVLRGQTDLTPEQGIGICQHWRFSERETDFFLLLLQRDRAGQKNLKDFLTQKIDRLRKESQDIGKRLQKDRLAPGEGETLYYTNWRWMALHVIVSIPEFQTTERIAERLSLSPALVEESLKKLQDIGVVQYSQGKWSYQVADIHLPKQSVLTSVHHNSWRQRAVEDSMRPQSDGVHYTGIHSISVKDYEILKEKILNFIAESRSIIGPSKEEEGIAITLDIFRI